MRLALVRYIGGRTGAFSVQVRGADKPRLWAKGQQDETAKERRWLPGDEAEQYDAMPDFTIIKWGTDEKTTVRTPKSHPDWTVPRAQHVSEFFDEQEAPVEAVSEIAPDVEPLFLMTKTGVVHTKGCTYAQRAKDPIPFQTLEEAAVHQDFQRYCKCILGEE